MAVSRVSGQTVGGETQGTTTISLAMPGDVTAGNLVVVGVIIDTDGVSTPTLAKVSGTATVGTITKRVSVASATTTVGSGCMIFTVPITGTGSLTLRCTHDNASYFVATAREYTGINTSAVEATQTNTGSTNGGTTPALGNLTSAGGALFFAVLQTYFFGSTTHTPGTDFTEVYEQEDGSQYMTGSIADRIVTSGTTDSPDWTTSSNCDQYLWSSCGVVIAEASGGTNHTLNLSDSGAASESALRAIAKALADSGAASESALRAIAKALAETATAGDVYSAVGPPATPTIEAGDCTESGNNSATTSWDISRPAQSDGDLIVVGLCSDANVTHTLPATGPNGETINTIENSYGGTAQRVSVFWWVADGAASAGTITVTPSASEQWTATAFLLPAGEFDATTPIGASATNNQTAVGATIDTPAFTAGASDGYGRLVAWIGNDVTRVTSAASGWSLPSSVDRGAMGGSLVTRDAAVTNSESISAASHTLGASETGSVVAFIVRAPVAAGTPYTLNLSDSAGTAEAFPRSAGKALTDSRTVAESFARALSRALGEAATAGDVRALLVGRALVEAVSGTDVRTMRAGKALADAAAGVEARTAAVGRALADGVTASEARAFAVARALSDGVGTAEDFASALVILRELSDTASASDARVVALARALADAASASDERVVLLARALAESVGTAEDFASALVIVRVLADVASASDARSMTTGRAIADTVGTAETRSSAVGRAVADTAGAADAVARVLSRILSDAATTAEDFATVSVIVRALADAVAASDSRAFVIGRAFAETAGAVDALARFVGRTLADSASTAEDFEAAIALITLALSDAVTVVEGRPAAAFARAVAETVALIEMRAGFLSRAMADAAAASDSRASTTGKAWTETVAAGDLGVARALERAMADAVTISDVARTIALARAIADAAGVVEGLVSQKLLPYVTPATRILAVLAEVRAFVVEQETRTVMVAADDRTDEVEP